jgi:hypothetical protein
MIALAALVVGGGVSAALLVTADPSRGTVEAYAAGRDVPAGAGVTQDAIQLTRVSLAGGTSLLFTHRDIERLTAMRAAHDITAGQLIQRSDVTSSTSIPDRRLVLIPLSAIPTVPAGARVDLLVIAGSADHPTVAPFALGVEVVASASGGLVVAVPAKAAAAFVFAGATMHLAAVVVEPGAADGAELPVATADDAMALAAGR